MEIKTSADVKSIAHNSGDLWTLSSWDDDEVPEQACPTATNVARVKEIVAAARRAQTEILDGTSITQLAARFGRMPPAEAAELICQFEFGAGHLHKLARLLEAARLRALVALAVSGKVHLDPAELLAFEREEAAKAGEAA